MRRTLALFCGVSLILALGVDLARPAQTALAPNLLPGSDQEEAGYIAPFDPGRVAVAAFFGPVAASGMSDPDTAGNSGLAPFAQEDEHPKD